MKIVYKPDGKYCYRELTESLAKELCIEEDLGERYSRNSRFIYSCEDAKEDKDIRFGTALAAVYFKIINLDGKSRDTRFDIE